MKRLPFIAALAFITVLFTVPWMLALTSGETYTVKVYKVNSDATTTLVDTAVAVADANGKISFTFSRIPTNTEANFLVFEMVQADGTVIKKSFVPAPPANLTNELGINAMSTSQTNCILAAGNVIHTDDPIVMAYLLVMVQTDGFTVDSAASMAHVGQAALLGTNGWVNYLKSNGVTDAQLTTLRSKIIYNDAEGSKDLRAFTSKFKSAVDNSSDSDMFEAGGYMAQIFVDAGMAAGIDPSLIVAAHDQAGVVCQDDPDAATYFMSLPASIRESINQSMSAFGTRIKSGVLIRQYSNALQALNASGDQVTQFQTAANKFIAATKEIDRQFGGFFSDPQGFLTTHPSYASADAVQNEVNTKYQAAFTTFQTDIAASDATITTLRANITSAFGGNLPQDFGTFRNFAGQTVNWPVTMVAIWNWLATINANGGSLTYDRTAMDTAMPVPTNMSWINNNAGTRTDFSSGGSCGNRCIMNQVMEDVNIAEFIRNVIYSNGQQQPTQAQQQASKAQFATNLTTIKGKFGGTKNSTGTAISDTEKDALIRLLIHPEM